MNNHVINCLRNDLAEARDKSPKSRARSSAGRNRYFPNHEKEDTSALQKRDAETDLRRQSACLAPSVNGSEVATMEEFDGADKPSPGAEPYIDRGA
jgi:hypothetical protein